VRSTSKRRRKKQECEPGTHRRRPDRRTRRRDRASGEGARRTTRSGQARFRTSRARAVGPATCTRLRSPPVVVAHRIIDGAGGDEGKDWREEPRLLVVEVEQPEQPDDDVIGPQASRRDQGDVGEPDRRRQQPALHRPRRKHHSRPARAHGRAALSAPPLGLPRGRRRAEREGGHLPFRAGDTPRPAADLRTLPNEGGTFGIMPVFLRICDENQRTESIIAPSITWNDVIHLTARSAGSTIRPTTSPDLHRSASTRINSNLLVQWRDLPRLPAPSPPRPSCAGSEAPSTASSPRPDTPTPRDQLHAHPRLRHAPRGLNLTSHWNAGAALFLGTDGSGPRVPGCRSARASFPMRRMAVPPPSRRSSTSASTAGRTRVLRPGSSPSSPPGRRRLVRSPTTCSAAPGSRPGARNGIRRRRRAARLEHRQLSGVPFYLQSTLACAYLLRGFTEDRFIDRSAWS